MFIHHAKTMRIAIVPVALGLLNYTSTRAQEVYQFHDRWKSNEYIRAEKPKPTAESKVI